MWNCGMIIGAALVFVSLALRPGTARADGCTQCLGEPCNGAVCFNGAVDPSKCRAIGCGLMSAGYMVPCDQASGNPCTVIDPTPIPTSTPIATPTPSLNEKPAPVLSSPALGLLLLALVVISIWGIRRKV